MKKNIELIIEGNEIVQWQEFDEGITYLKDGKIVMKYDTAKRIWKEMATIMGRDANLKMGKKALSERNKKAANARWSKVIPR